MLAVTKSKLPAMHRSIRFSALVLVLLFQLTALHAQPAGETYEQDHIELRALKDRLVDGINKGDIDAINADLHPNVVITWQDGQVCKGHESLRQFYANMMGKSKKTFQGYKVPPTADEKTILYSGGTTGVVYGKSVGRLFLAGHEIEVPYRWSASFV